MYKNLKSYHPKTFQWIFIVLFLIISMVYSYHQILGMRPQSIHQWRQADCLSITMNYFMENNPFLEPSIHRIGACGNGKTVSEFPIIYYFVAQIWKITGQQEGIFRLVNVLFLFSGLFALFKFSEAVLKDSVWALFITFFLFSSPILVFYGNNFMADVPALSAALIGWFFFWKFHENANDKWLVLAVTFFTLGILLKASAIMSFAAIGFIFLLEFFNVKKFKQGTKIFQSPWKQSLAFIIPLLIAVGWYSYAKSYQSQYNSDLNLIGTLPIWEMDKTFILEISKTFILEMLPAYSNRISIALLIVLFFSLFVSRKKVNAFFLYVSTLLFIAFVAFLLLFFQVFTVHDYYLINMLIFIPFVLISFLLFIKENHVGLFYSKILRVCIGVLIAFSIYFTSTIQTAKYFTIYSPLLSQTQTDYWKWHHWYYEQHLKAFETITPYLRSLGIQREDRVFSTPDQSINISLYLMDQKGWTDFMHGDFAQNDAAFMEYIIEHDAKYLIINDKEKLKADFLQPYLANKIGVYQNVEIFDLRK